MKNSNGSTQEFMPDNQRPGCGNLNTFNRFNAVEVLLQAVHFGDMVILQNATETDENERNFYVKEEEQ